MLQQEPSYAGYARCLARASLYGLTRRTTGLLEERIREELDEPRRPVEERLPATLDRPVDEAWDRWVERACVFADPAADRLFWAPTLQARPRESGREWYTLALGSIHEYVARGPDSEGERFLWQACWAMEQAVGNATEALPWQWADLLSSVVARVQADPRFSLEQRQRMLAQVRLAGSQPSCQDLESYLRFVARSVGSGGRETWRLGRREFEEVLRASRRVLARESRHFQPKTHALVADLLGHRSRGFSWSNRDLRSLWKAACGSESWDLAWRCGTVLAARGALPEAAERAWEVSGERRSEYGYQTVDRSVADRVSEDFPEGVREAVRGLAIVGPALPELLGLLDRRMSLRRAPGLEKASQEGRLESLLIYDSWIRRRRWRTVGPGAGLSVIEVPPFCQALPPQAWSQLVALLGDGLGLGAMRWSPSVLLRQLAPLLPQLASRERSGQVPRSVRRWMASLDSEGQHGFSHLVAGLRRMDAEDGHLWLSAFVCRMATTMLQSHFEALVGLQHMGAPIWLIWNLEKWILSEGYTRLRMAAGSASRVPVPRAIWNLELRPQGAIEATHEGRSRQEDLAARG